MKFVVEKEIFEKLPTACFGVVVAKGIDNGKSYPTVDALLDESIAVAAAHFEGKKVKEEPEILPEDIPLDIVYEDHDVILVNKPKGMVVHPAAGH